MRQVGTDEGEFSGGGGLIDPIRRAARVIGQQAGPVVQGPSEELMEIYATNPTDPDSGPENSEPGVAPAPRPWPDPSTAKGTS
jgi:hypothetical protein